jgi:hypothetical protein
MDPGNATNWPAPTPDEHGRFPVIDPDNKTVWDGRVPQFCVPVPWPKGAELRRTEPQEVPDAEAGIEKFAKEK